MECHQRGLDVCRFAGRIAVVVPCHGEVTARVVHLDAVFAAPGRWETTLADDVKPFSAGGQFRVGAQASQNIRSPWLDFAGERITAFVEVNADVRVGLGKNKSDAVELDSAQEGSFDGLEIRPRGAVSAAGHLTVRLVRYFGGVVATGFALPEHPLVHLSERRGEVSGDTGHQGLAVAGGAALR